MEATEALETRTATAWPTDPAALAAGRAFLAAAAHGPVAVAADRDVDGLTAAVLVQRALGRLGASAVTVIPVRKGEHVHAEPMRERLWAARPDALVVVDAGSRAGAILPRVPTLVIDHHQPSGGPDGALLVSAYGHEPVASTSVLAYELARGLVDVADLDWLALLGAVADLGTELPFPAMAAALRRHRRTAVTGAVALLNAARRAGDEDVAVALRVLAAAPGPAAIASGQAEGVEVLRACRAHVQAEVTRWGRTAPRRHGPLSVVRISSPAQIHPLLAARWMRRLRGTVVLVANDGYLPGRVNFAMRTTLDANLVDWLRSVPAGTMRGEGEWGHGHPRATGGSLSPDDFERLLDALARQPLAGWAGAPTLEPSATRDPRVSPKRPSP
jgi:single-stranded DNA-specific DHH superfamily exonuclease